MPYGRIALLIVAIDRPSLVVDPISKAGPFQHPLPLLAPQRSSLNHLPYPFGGQPPMHPRRHKLCRRPACRSVGEAIHLRRAHQLRQGFAVRPRGRSDRVGQRHLVPGVAHQMQLVPKPFHHPHDVPGLVGVLLAPPSGCGGVRGWAPTRRRSNGSPSPAVSPPSSAPPSPAAAPSPGTALATGAERVPPPAPPETGSGSGHGALGRHVPYRPTPASRRCGATPPASARTPRPYAPFRAAQTASRLRLDGCGIRLTVSARLPPVRLRRRRREHTLRKRRFGG